MAQETLGANALSPCWPQLLSPLWLCSSHLTVPESVSTFPLCLFVHSAFFPEGSSPRCLHSLHFHPPAELCSNLTYLVSLPQTPPVKPQPHTCLPSFHLLFLLIVLSTIGCSTCILLINVISLTASSHKNKTFTRAGIVSSNAGS